MCTIFYKNANMLKSQSHLIYYTVFFLFLYRLCNHHYHREFWVFQLPIIAVGLLAILQKKNRKHHKRSKSLRQCTPFMFIQFLIELIYLQIFHRVFLFYFILFYFLWRDINRGRDWNKTNTLAQWFMEKLIGSLFLWDRTCSILSFIFSSQWSKNVRIKNKKKTFWKDWRKVLIVWTITFGKK